MARVIGDSTIAAEAAVLGTNKATRTGEDRAAAVEGVSDLGVGVYGHSLHGRGVEAWGGGDYGLRAHGVKTGVKVTSDTYRAIEAVTTSKAEGVLANSNGGAGVAGMSFPDNGPGGSGSSGHGVTGDSVKNSAAAAGVFGKSGAADNHTPPPFGAGVWGASNDGTGVWATSNNSEALHAETRAHQQSALAVYQLDPTSDSAALFVVHKGDNKTAAFFQGNVIVTGDITLANADCAEDFDIAGGSSTEPGTVMVLEDESKLRESFLPYDKRVAGVISGAGDYKPALILDKQQSRTDRKPIALVGKTFCKVDAQFGAIEVGDLLTTSPTAGHAMRTDDPLQAFGAVIGKALRPLRSGQGLIPILIALQ
jgi:hypothetical protein